MRSTDHVVHAYWICHCCCACACCQLKSGLRYAQHFVIGFTDRTMRSPWVMGKLEASEHLPTFMHPGIPQCRSNELILNYANCIVLPAASYIDVLIFRIMHDALLQRMHGASNVGFASISILLWNKSLSGDIFFIFWTHAPGSIACCTHFPKNEIIPSHPTKCEYIRSGSILTIRKAQDSVQVFARRTWTFSSLILATWEQTVLP